MSHRSFFRHVSGVELSHVHVDYAKPEARPAFVLDDVLDACFDHLKVARGTEGAALFNLRHVPDFSATASRSLTDTKREGTVERENI